MDKNVLRVRHCGGLSASPESLSYSPRNSNQSNSLDRIE